MSDHSICLDSESSTPLNSLLPKRFAGWVIDKCPANCPSSSSFLSRHRVLCYRGANRSRRWTKAQANASKTLLLDKTATVTLVSRYYRARRCPASINMDTTDAYNGLPKSRKQAQAPDLRAPSVDTFSTCTSRRAWGMLLQRAQGIRSPAPVSFHLYCGRKRNQEYDYPSGYR